MAVLQLYAAACDLHGDEREREDEREARRKFEKMEEVDH
jgi:hypothetical protein